MQNLAVKAAKAWGFQSAPVFVAHRENAVYRLTDNQHNVFALRLHRSGYNKIAHIQSELDWMEYLAQFDFNVPKPLRSLKGKYCELLDDVLVDVISWLDGTPMGQSGVALNLPNPRLSFDLIGETIANIHQVSDSWIIPKNFERQAWDLQGLLGPTPVWGAFWKNSGLSKRQKNTIDAARTNAFIELDQLAGQLDYGLIHADLVRENLLFNTTSVQIIDFDDCGFGFRLFELATALYKNQNEPDFESLKSALLCGYQKIRPLDTQHIELFMLLRSFTYLGWIMERMQQVGAQERSDRYITDAVTLSEHYLSR